MQRHLALWIASVILIGTSEAQVLQPFPFTYQGRTPWPSALPSPGAFTRQVTADFTGDGLKDVFVLAGGTPLFFYAPDSWEVLYPVSNSGDPAYNDMALIPSTASSLPQIALVGAGGLQRLVYYPPTDPPIAPVGGVLVAGSFARYPIATGSAWTNAKLVRAGYVDSGPEIDYVGLKADSHTVVVRRGTSSGTVQSSFYVAETVYDIALLHWNGTPESEIAILDGYGVDIYSNGGTLLQRFTRPASGTEAIAVFQKNIISGGVQVVDAHEKIAWARQRGTQPASQEIVELSSAYSLVVSNVLITDPLDPIVSMSAADLSTDTEPADGNWELVVHHEHDCAPFVFKNLGPSMIPVPSFSNQGVPDTLGSTWQKLDLASLQNQSAGTIPGSNIMAAPLCADLNGDGKIDVHVAVQAGTASFFQCWRGGTEVALGGGDTVGPGAFVSRVVHYQAPIAGVGPHGLEFRIDLGVLPWPSNANAIEWTIWRRDAVTGDYSACQHVYYTIPPGPVPTGFVYPIAPVEFPNYPTCSDNQYWYEIRFASEISPGVLVARSIDYIDAVGTYPSQLMLLEQLDYSVENCVANTGGCPGAVAAHCENDGRPITSPLSITRRRMVAPSSGYMPIPPEALHVGDVPTQSHS